MRFVIGCGLIVAFSAARAQTVDDKGRKQGHWVKKDEKTGKVIYEGDFRDDMPVGKFRYFYPNDSVRAVMNFRNDGKTAYAHLFHMNGKAMAEGKYVNREIKDSVWAYYDELGTLISKETWANGKKNGPSYVYLPDGAVSEERHFKDGAEHGKFIQYFDGKLVRAEGNYVNGVMEGRVRYMYPNGIEAAAGYYKHGNRSGPWIFRDKSGKITEKQLYKDGVPASKKEADAFFAKNKVQETQQPSGNTTTQKTKPKKK